MSATLAPESIDWNTVIGGVSMQPLRPAASIATDALRDANRDLERALMAAHELILDQGKMLGEAREFVMEASPRSSKARVLRMRIDQHLDALDG